MKKVVDCNIIYQCHNSFRVYCADTGKLVSHTVNICVFKGCGFNTGNEYMHLHLMFNGGSLNIIEYNVNFLQVRAQYEVINDSFSC
jgi:hypothetical protein